MFERTELISRRRVEAMEVVSWKCIGNEKERRIDPEAWVQKTSVKGPSFVFAKLLTGNRAIPQQLFKIYITNQMSLLDLKGKISEEAVKNGNHPLKFAPNLQKLFLFGKELQGVDDGNTTVSAAGIPHGSTLHFALKVSDPKFAIPAVFK